MARAPIIVFDTGYAAQRIKGVNPRELWELVDDFLEKCTDANSMKPNGAGLTIYGPKEGESREWFDIHARHFESILGPRNTVCGITIEGSEGGRQMAFWANGQRDFENNIGYFLDNCSARLTSGEAKLSASYSFQLRSDSGVTFPEQEGYRNMKYPLGVSNIHLEISRLSSMSLTATFPFPSVSADFLSYLRFFSAHCPIHLLPTRFTLHTPTVEESFYGFAKRKIKSSDIHAIEMAVANNSLQARRP